MIVIGGGIAGRMASGYFDRFSPEVYEARKDGASSHQAIMRFRDFSIGYLLGTPLEKINVTKAIFYEGNFVEPSPKVLNYYSRKVARGIYPRSIRFTEPVERFVTKEPFRFKSANYGHHLIKAEPNKCLFSVIGKDIGEISVIDYDVCISTIPLPVLAKAAGMDMGKTKIESYPVYVARYKVNIPSKVYQTVYFPEPGLNAYRASLENQDFIIESSSSNIDSEVEEISSAFGLFSTDLQDKHQYTQENGKIVEIDDTIRKKVLFELTDKYHIYSLGRYATWRNITADALVKDLDKIADMMKMSESTRKYSMTLEAASGS